MPYSNVMAVDAPLGFTVPFKMAEVEATEVADPVVTVGTMAEVVKVWSVPSVVPVLFVATSR